MDQLAAEFTINGQTIEVPVSALKVATKFKIGDNIKVLVKEYDTYKTMPGVLIGIEPFKNLPSIIVACLKVDYSTTDIVFLTINDQVKNVEICLANVEMASINKEQVIQKLDGMIRTHTQEIAELERKKAYFLSNFGKYFAKDE